MTIAFILLALMVIIAAGALRWTATSFINVPAGTVGIVNRRFGWPSQDEKFNVRVHGGQGVQADVLKENQRYFRPAILYKVTYVPRTVVPPGTIAVVVARAGGVAPTDRLLSRHIDCDHFQDGRAFLLGGGEQGRQPAILPGGARYDINTQLFEVITTGNIGDGRHGLTADDLQQIVIFAGEVGVVITRDGAPPETDEVGLPIAGHRSFQLPWVFLDAGGRSGVQEQTLGEGTYRINPWFAKIVRIPTTSIILEWKDRAAKASADFDISLDQIVVTVEGFRLRTHMTQTIRIPRRAAPRLVGHFGESTNDSYGASDSRNPTPIQRFVQRVLGPVVAGSFQAIAAETDVATFMEQYSDVRLRVEGMVRQALDHWGIEAGRTTLHRFEPMDDHLNSLLQAPAQERERGRQLDHRLDNRRKEDAIDQYNLAAERERKKIEVAADVAKLEAEIGQLGADHVAMDRFLGHLSSMGVPQVVGGPDASAVLQYLPLTRALDLIHQSRRPAGPVDQIGPGTDPPRLPAAEDSSWSGDDGNGGAWTWNRDTAGDGDGDGDDDGPR